MHIFDYLLTSLPRPVLVPKLRVVTDDFMRDDDSGFIGFIANFCKENRKNQLHLDKSTGDVGIERRQNTCIYIILMVVYSHH